MKPSNKATSGFLLRLAAVLAGAGSAIFSLASSALGAELRLSISNAGSNTVSVQHPSQTNAYYVLNSSTNVSGGFGPVKLSLGTSGTGVFQLSTQTNSLLFFRLLELPQTSPNDYDRDGIPDVWELNRSPSLDPLLGIDAARLAPGSTNTWLNWYRNDASNDLLPVVYFPTASSVVSADATNVTVPVAFTTPFTGRLTYQVSGTAIPGSSGVDGDYVPPVGFLNLSSATLATIPIRLVSRPAVEIDRTLVIALSRNNSARYAISSDKAVHQIQVAQSTQGVFIGTLTITNGLFIGAQSVKMALRPGAGGNAALFDVAGSPLLGDVFSVQANASSNGFQLLGNFSRQVTNASTGRTLLVTLAFGQTQTSDGDFFTTPVIMTVDGLTASRRGYAGVGNLNLNRSR